MDRPYGHHPIDNEDEPLFHFDLHEQLIDGSVQPTFISPVHVSESGITGTTQAERSVRPTHPRDVKGKGTTSSLRPIRIPYVIPSQASRKSSSSTFSPIYGSFSDSSSYDVPGSLTSAASTSFGTSAVRTPSDHDDFMQQFAAMGFDYGSNGGHISASPIFSFSEGKAKGKASIFPPLTLSRQDHGGNASHSAPSHISPDSIPTFDIDRAEPPPLFGSPLLAQPHSPTSVPGDSLRSRSHRTMPRYRKPGEWPSKGIRHRKSSQRDVQGDVYEQKHIRAYERESFQPPSPLLSRHNRSYSSPPFSPFDLVASTRVESLQPISFIPRDYFGDMLPRELQLRVFASLLKLHEAEHLDRISSCTWTCQKAASHRHQWVGRSKGMRELVKFSRVSKIWKTLVFDGELWCSFQVPSSAQFSSRSMLAIAEVTGSLMTKLIIPGQIALRNNALIQLTELLCVKCIQPNIASYTQITSVDLSFCRKLSSRTPGLHHLILRAPSLRSLRVRGLGAVTNMTCSLLALHCPLLQNLDISRCPNVDGQGLRSMASIAETWGRPLELRRLLACAIESIDDDTLRAIGKVTPFMEALDLSYTRLHNSALEAFVACDGIMGEQETVLLTASQAGRSHGNQDFYRRRVTRIRHLNLSACTLLTDTACTSLAYALPSLEFLELAAIGTSMKDDGLIHLLKTTPILRKLDLEGASSITDALVIALTPPLMATEDETTNGIAPPLGSALTHLSLSHANNITNETLLSVIRACTRLRVLEVDETRISSQLMKEFIHVCKERQMIDSKLVAVDCRGVSEALVKQLSPSIRPRQGWRAYEARKLHFVDGRDDLADELKLCEDECDERRVVLKSFYSWQAVDAVAAAREARRKASTKRENSSSSDSSVKNLKWWSRSSGTNSPATPSDGDRDGCIIM